MADVKNCVSIQFVWGTYDRLPKLTPEVMAVVRTCVNEVADEMRCPLIAFGGVEDHVHVLVHFATTVTMSELVKRMKGKSSRAVNVRFPNLKFKWQGAYGAFPVTPQLKKYTTEYIVDQEERHRTRDLKPLLEDMGLFCDDDP